MNALRHHLRPATWLALVAMLALALAPTVSHAFSHWRGTPGALAEICTPQGMQRLNLAAAAGEETQPVTLDAHAEHCAYCALGATLALAPPPAATVLLPPPPAHAMPARFLHAPRTLFAWVAAQPRGPPFIS